MSEPPNSELLSQFVRERSETAFRLLVERHLPLVHSTALRVTSDAHLAEDVSQAVFVSLAGQARQVLRKLDAGTPLAGWLHVTTRNIATKVIRTEARRRNREQATATMQIVSNTPADAPWERIMPHLDEALAALTACDRNALLLRYFERRTAREIGIELGISEQACQKRLGRAVDRLRRHLSRRGLGISSAALTAALASEAAGACPAALAGSITAAALNPALVSAASATAAGWLNVSTTIAMNKVQASLCTTVALLVAVPLTVQQVTLNAARTRLAALSVPPALSSLTEESAVATPVSPPSEVGELERLRAEITRLQSELVARKGPTRPPGSESRPAGPTLLATGRTIPVSDLVYAGASTPEAALQSHLSLQRDGVIEGVMALMLQPPGDAERLMMMSDEEREQLRASLRSQVQTITHVTLLENRPISETRAQLVVRQDRANGPVTNIVSWGKTSSGWKLIL